MSPSEETGNGIGVCIYKSTAISHYSNKVGLPQSLQKSPLRLSGTPSPHQLIWTNLGNCVCENRGAEYRMYHIEHTGAMRTFGSLTRTKPY